MYFRPAMSIGTRLDATATDAPQWALQIYRGSSGTNFVHFSKPTTVSIDKHDTSSCSRFNFAYDARDITTLRSPRGLAIILDGHRTSLRQSSNGDVSHLHAHWVSVRRCRAY